MPTYCEPWPGNTNARLASVPGRSAVATPTLTPARARAGRALTGVWRVQQGPRSSLAGLVDQRLQAADLGLDLGRAERAAGAHQRLGLLGLQLREQHIGLF